MKIDFRDIITFGGIALMGIGSYLVDPHLALITVGLAFFFLGLMGLGAK